MYVEYRQGIYGMLQAGILAQKILEERLNTKGCHWRKTISGLWTHKYIPMSFTLMVNNFGVKYVGEEHTQHILSAIEEDCECKTEWEGTKYIGLTVDWD